MAKNETKKLTWFDISLEQYHQIEKIQNEHPDDSAIQIAKYLFDIDLEFLPVTEFCRIMDELQFLGEPIPKTNLKLNYRINGTEYELDITPADMTTAQFIDAQNYIKDASPIENLLSVYLIPKGKKYAEDYDIEKVKKDVLSLPMPEVIAITSFFQNWLVRFVKVFRACLKRKMRKGMDKETADKIRRLMDEAERNMALAFCPMS